MKLYYYLLIIIAILLNSMVITAIAQPPLPAPKATKLPEQLADFNVISVRGPVVVTLEQLSDEKPNFFQIMGTQYSPVSVTVKENTLYIQAEDSDHLNGVTVGIHQLNQLVVDGVGSVISKKLTSASLSIDANTSGSIQLFGMMTVERILDSGRGLLQIQWIDSPRLRIDGSDSSQIQVAGVANSVEMRLRDNSQFQGQYLRIDRIFIQTKDHSTAKLLVNDSLRAFAYDNSNIYYYKRPTELTEFTSDSGNVLQLGWGQ